jgi:hypothetical protein
LGTGGSALAVPLPTPNEAAPSMSAAPTLIVAVRMFVTSPDATGLLHE